MSSESGQISQALWIAFSTELPGRSNSESSLGKSLLEIYKHFLTTLVAESLLPSKRLLEFMAID
jgi:hypothetical protein